MPIIDMKAPDVKPDDQVSNDIITVPNIITFIRLACIPIFLILLLQGQDVASAIVFGITAATDFLDGMIARKTHSVSRLGQLLDPATDRLLMITAVIGLLIVGRLPLWIIILVLVRDLLLLAGGYYLMKVWRVRVAVLYLGKIATALLFFGCAFLLLNMPIIGGLGWCDFAWLPGFNSDPCCWAIWLVYAGLVLAIVTTVYYIKRGIEGYHLAKSQRGAADRS
ncbi:MAG: CDP-alcohol phosphatidyltransferase family protein [Eggerthellaceae bacterium]|jgi:cardiolipin synthase